MRKEFHFRISPPSTSEQLADHGGSNALTLERRECVVSDLDPTASRSGCECADTHNTRVSFPEEADPRRTESSFAIVCNRLRAGVDSKLRQSAQVLRRRAIFADFQKI